MSLEEVTLDENWVMSDRPEKGDENLLVRFYLRPRQNMLKTEGGEISVTGPRDPRLLALLKDADSTGVKVDFDAKTKTAFVTGAARPIFDEVEFVEIRVPDKIDKYNQIDRPATQRDRRRFKRQYAEFKAAQGDTTSGTPLSKWPLITASQVEELKYLKVDGEPFPIRSVEELARFPDDFIASMGHLGKLKAQAVAFLETARGQAPTVRLQSELAQRDVLIESLQRQMEEMKALITSTSETKPATGPVEIVAASAPIPKRGRPAKQITE